MSESRCVDQEKQQTKGTPAAIYMTVILVAILACAATAFEFYSLAVMSKERFQSDAVVSVLTAYFLGGILLLLISRGRLLRPLIASVFCMASLYLLSQTAISLFVAADYLYAIENAMWMIPLQVCLFATLGRRIASVLAGSLFGLMLTLLSAYFIIQQMNPASNEETHAACAGGVLPSRRSSIARRVGNLHS